MKVMILGKKRSSAKKSSKREERWSRTLHFYQNEIAVADGGQLWELKGSHPNIK